MEERYPCKVDVRSSSLLRSTDNEEDKMSDFTVSNYTESIARRVGVYIIPILNSAPTDISQVVAIERHNGLRVRAGEQSWVEDELRRIGVTNIIYITCKQIEDLKRRPPKPPPPPPLIRVNP